MPLNNSRVIENIIVAVVTAAVISIAGLISSWLPGGGAIRFLGGVTQAELLSVLQNQAKQDPENWEDIVLAVPGLAIPAEAVVAFDSSRSCPKGWSVFKAAQGGMMIVAAAEDGAMAKAAAKDSTVAKAASNVPPDKMPGSDDISTASDYPYRKSGKFASPKNLKYISLYFCKKN